MNCGINSKIVTFLFASANEKQEDITRVKLRKRKDAKLARVEELEKPASMIKKAQTSGKRCLAEMSFAYLTFVETFVSKLTALVAAKNQLYRPLQRLLRRLKPPSQALLQTRRRKRKKLPSQELFQSQSIRMLKLPSQVSLQNLRRKVRRPRSPSRALPQIFLWNMISSRSFRLLVVSRPRSPSVLRSKVSEVLSLRTLRPQ